MKSPKAVIQLKRLSILSSISMHALTFPRISGHPRRATREDVHMPKRNRRRFTAEQKADAVHLVREVGSISQVASELDLSETALRNWVKQAEVDEGHGPEGALTTDEKEELQRLRRENRTLKMERAFLKKAATFFAKEQDRSSC